jgi:hypothetical protein
MYIQEVTTSARSNVYKVMLTQSTDEKYVS